MNDPNVNSLEKARVAGQPFLSDLSAQLAMEIATGLCSVASLMERYDMTEAGFKRLLGIPVFQRMVRDAKAKWDADLNANERIRVKAAIALEDSIPAIYDMLHDLDNPANSRIEAAKTLGKFAKADTPDAAGAAGGAGFQVIIRLDDKEVRVAGKAAPTVIDAEQD